MHHRRRLHGRGDTGPGVSTLPPQGGVLPLTGKLTPDSPKNQPQENVYYQLRFFFDHAARGKYWRFKFDRKKYSEVNDALKELTHLTAREWAIARLCADFKDHGRSQMTWIGENLPELVPFMEGKYQRQDVSSAQAAFKRKVVRSGTTFFYAYYPG